MYVPALAIASGEIGNDPLRQESQIQQLLNRQVFGLGIFFGRGFQDDFQPFQSRPPVVGQSG
jgi:hypothetical protein